LRRNAILPKSNTKTDIGDNIGNIIYNPVLISFNFRKIVGHYKKEQCAGHIYHDTQYNKEIGGRIYEKLVLLIDLFIKIKQAENDKSDRFQGSRKGIKILLVRLNKNNKKV
jgi:hypothetical protein